MSRRKNEEELFDYIEDDPKSREERLHKDRDTEIGAPLAPMQNRPPGEQHRGGPLPNQKK